MSPTPDSEHYILTWATGQGIIHAKCRCGDTFDSPVKALSHALEFRAHIPPWHRERLRAGMEDNH